jgi:hypothetical protein
LKEWTTICKILRHLGEKLVESLLEASSFPGRELVESPLENFIVVVITHETDIEFVSGSVQD